jgi:hypothetical protein
MSISNEELLKLLEKDNEIRKEEYIKFKGMIQGLRLTNLTESEKEFLAIFELFIDNLKFSGDNLNFLRQIDIYLMRRIDVLEKEVNQLKNSIDTLDKNR